MDLSPLFVSLRVSICSVIVTFILGTIVAHNMYLYKGKYKTLIDSIINITLFLPPVATGFFLLLVFSKKSVIGLLLNSIGIQLIFTWQGAVLSSIFITFPLMYGAIITSFKHIDKEIIDMARVSGASEIQTFIFVIIPLSINGLVMGVILSFLRSIGEFGATIMIAGNIPNKTQTISSAIYFYASSGDFNSSLFWVIIITAISILFMGMMKLMYR